MIRSRQITIRELCCSLLKLYYNIRNLIRFCKQGVVAACCIHANCSSRAKFGVRSLYILVFKIF